MKKPIPIINYLKDPTSFDQKAFETAIRNEVEILKGQLTASEELLVGMLVMTVKTMVDAQIEVIGEGYIYKFNAGPAPSPWVKLRTESLDKAIKILKELQILNKTVHKPSEVDELFESA